MKKQTANLVRKLGLIVSPTPVIKKRGHQTTHG